MLILNRLDKLLSVANYYLEQLRQKSVLAIMATVIFICTILMHSIIGGSLFFFVDVCVLIGLYRSLQAAYINAHYPKQ
ncbi:hypothetical protein BKK50_08970 [Rodentibacter rarus]|uniref:Uncharacterized protein n=1 Tax=Rodentibacter rarus TaxID=1908260 RepID=A0A1V3IJE4_9PAST|nr:hypothetical protein BKK50_08970 [Rodentibacter rarus]